MRQIAATTLKGTGASLEAARHLAIPGNRLLSLSNGGDDFLEYLFQGAGGSWRQVPAAHPFGRVRPIPVLKLDDMTMAMESAKVIGLAGLVPLNPLTASRRDPRERLASLYSSSRLWISLWAVRPRTVAGTDQNSACRCRVIAPEGGAPREHSRAETAPSVPRAASEPANECCRWSRRQTPLPGDLAGGRSVHHDVVRFEKPAKAAVPP